MVIHEVIQPHFSAIFDEILLSGFLSFCHGLRPEEFQSQFSKRNLTRSFSIEEMLLKFVNCLPLRRAKKTHTIVTRTDTQQIASVFCVRGIVDRHIINTLHSL
jgi:hypothetical protein